VKTRQVFMGIDVGTSAVKVVLVRLDGQIVSEAFVEQAVVEPNPTWAEQDPEILWQSTRTAIKKVISNCAQLPYSTEIIGISVTGQMHSGVFLDQARNIIRPAILWNDSRTSSQCEEIIGLVGIDRLYQEIGNMPLEGFTAPKILWLRQNEPDNYSQLRTILMPKDYIRYRLTGELATDESDAAGTILYDVRKQEWSKPILESLDIDSSILPQVLKSTDVCGTLSKFIARDLRLPEAIPVVCGGADNAVGAVSSGVVVPGQIQSSIGTSGTISTPVTTPTVAADMSLHMFSHCVPDIWYLMGTILSAGNSLKWLRNTFAPTESYKTIVDRARDVNAGAEGLVFLPYLSGERTPHNNPNARGVFFGLSTGHTFEHFTRAVLEGVAFALRDSLELIKILGISVNTVRGIGGGNSSTLWRQIQSNVFNLPVANVLPGGGPAYGAAMLASVGVNHFSSIYDCVDQWIQETTIVNPIQSEVYLYQELYDNYGSLYRSLEDRFDDLHDSVKKYPTDVLGY